MKYVSWRLTLPLFAAALLAPPGVVEAKYDVNRPAPTAKPASNRISASLCLVSSSRSELDINNVRAMVLNGGDMWWDLSNPRYEVPKVTEANQPRRHSIFAGSLWIGGQDDAGQLYVSAQTYRQGSPADVGFWPGPLDDQGNIDADICSAWNSHAKINRSVIDDFRSTPLPTDPSALPGAIRDWPGRNNPYLTRPRLNQELAPFIDVDGDGNYDPLRGDYPDVRGDQAIWWVINDAGNVKVPLTPPIGLEIDVMAFAFSTANPINNMTFYQQKVINKSQKTLRNTYIGQWVDADLGFFNDDYVGCDVGRGLGFCYNGDNFDEGVTGYGENPPTVAVDFFEGPLADANDGIDNDRDSYSSGTFNPALVDEPGEKIIMSNFVYYNNDFSINGNPTEAVHFYNYLRSKITTGQDLQFGGDGLSNTNGQNYAFMFPAGGSTNSDPYGFGFRNPPVAGQVPPYDWSESNTDGRGRRNVPADRRFLQSAGPFTLLPGAVNQVTIGVIWARAGAGGPQGSVGLATFADDLAQSLFDRDFQLPATPPQPKLIATELDRQIVLSIQPGEVRLPNGRIFNTETFVEEDTTLPAGVTDKFFRFEGYLVYETRGSDVTGEGLDDPDQARLIARYDVVNDIGQLVNYEFKPALNDVVPVVKVDNENINRGIFHTINVTNTRFSTSTDSRLVNFKRYYFQVVPYAANKDRTVNSSRRPLVIEPYRAGRAGTVSAIPSNPVVLNGGTTLNSSVYSELPITRQLGEGNGGAVLEISAANEAEILANNQKLQLDYNIGKSPINVRVYDPKRVRDERFTVKFSTRLSYLASSVVTGTQIQENDILVSTGQYDRGETARLTATPASAVAIDNGDGPQIKGRAIARKLLGVQDVVTGNGADKLISWEIEMLNDDRGGTFTANIARYTINVVSPTVKDSAITSYEEEPRAFQKEDGSFQATAKEFALHDIWKWKTAGQADWNYVARRVSEVNEELLPEYGLSIQVRPGRNPGYRTNFNVGAQFLEATLTQARPAWLTGVPNEAGSIATTRLGIPWLLTENSTTNTKLWDPAAAFSRLLPIEIPGFQSFGGTWAAYTNTGPVNSLGAAYTSGPALNARRLYNLHNIDVVMTADKSKWTRVAVLQINSANPAYALTKRGSTKPSVGKDGQPDNSTAPSGQPSTGMGWFPGYAIDLDRGLRLNMAFAESSSPVDQGGQGSDLGADLIWSPGVGGAGAQKYSGRNFIYVSDQMYDEGREMERQQDVIGQLTANAAKKQFSDLYDQFMYVGYPRLIAGQQLLQSDARVRIRVNREFASYPGLPANSVGPNQNPEYSFSLQGRTAVSNQRDVACKALSLVRIVPNPYYAFSTYEDGQIATFTRITNLPRKAQITIYTLNGTLVRRINKDDGATWTDFNMRNDSALPIASGIYLFHVKDVSTGCEEIVKWFCVMRPVDLDTF